MSEWIAVTVETMPKAGRFVLAHFRNRAGLSRVVRAMYATEKMLEADDDAPDEWYDEGSDQYWAPAGWYEVNYGDERIMRIPDPTHWQPLPLPPT